MSGSKLRRRAPRKIAQTTSRSMKRVVHIMSNLETLTRTEIAPPFFCCCNLQFVWNGEAAFDGVPWRNGEGLPPSPDRLSRIHWSASCRIGAHCLNFAIRCRLRKKMSGKVFDNHISRDVACRLPVVRAAQTGEALLLDVLSDVGCLVTQIAPHF